MRTTCEQCGRAPVKLVTSRKHLGMIFFGRTWSRQALLCRDHARQQLAADLAFTALLGWWGVISMFINAGIVVTQVLGLSEAGRLGAPQLTSGPGGTPMPEGRA